MQATAFGHGQANVRSEPTLAATKKFTRINRSAIINLSRVQSLKNWFHGECLVVLTNGVELKVSVGRRQLEHLLERLV